MGRRDGEIPNAHDGIAATFCPECGAPGGRIHAFSCSRYPDFNRPRIALTEANLRALKLGYAVVTSEAVIEVECRG